MVNWKHHQLDLNTNWNHTPLREHMTNATRNVERTLQLYFHQAYPQIALHFCSYSFHVSVFSLFWNGMLVLPFLLAMVVLLFVLSLYTRPALYFPSAFACARIWLAMIIRFQLGNLCMRNKGTLFRAQIIPTYHQTPIMCYQKPLLLWHCPHTLSSP